MKTPLRPHDARRSVTLVLVSLLFAVPSFGADGSFAVDLYKSVAAKQGNVFFSPYSISAAMGMARKGARGATAAEIDAVIKAPVSQAGTTAGLNIANALWAAKDIPLREDYRRAVIRDFGATVETVDFTGESAARARINQWVSKETRGKIPELIAPGVLTSDTRLVLTNAIYMRSKWRKPFSEKLTDPNGRFLDRKAVMMSNVDTFRFLHTGGVRLIEMPYEDSDLSMIAVLPDARNGLAAVEQSLTGEGLEKWMRGLRTATVNVKFPRFKLESSLELASTLQRLGIRQAFTENADFSGISDDENVMISRVIHKARVDVTEKETEAAAATAVTMRVTSAAPVEQPKYEEFIADHPFMFLIRRGPTNEILFMGRVTAP